jgi:transposase
MESMGRKRSRPRRSFTPEFKAEIVELCQRGDRSVGQVARDFDLIETAVPTERHRATPSDARHVTGGQGVAGSNPAVPTVNRAFSNIVTSCKSQQESQLVVQRTS